MHPTLSRQHTLRRLNTERKKTYLIWGAWAALALISSCFVSAPQSGSAAYSATAFWAACLLHVGLYFLTTRGNTGERFFLILSYAAFFTACCAVTQYVEAFILPKTGWLYLLVYGVSLSAMLWIFLGKLLPVLRQSAAYIGREWHILSALMALFMVALMTWFVFPSHITDFTFEQAVGLPVLIIVMFVTYGVIFVCIRNIAAAERAKQMELRLKLLTTQVEAQTQASDEARRARHDLRHHNLALLALAEQGNTAELVRYLRSMTEAEHAAETIWCENDTLSSILSVYVAKAAAAGIKTDVLAQAERNLAIPPDELVTVAANLLENAINGAAASGAPEPYITVRIHRKSDKLVIRMENACRPQLEYPEGFPGEKYGVGLLSVQQTVETHEGELSLTAKDGVFTALALLNLPE